MNTFFPRQSLNLENKLPYLIFHHLTAEYECHYVLSIALLACAIAFLWYYLLIWKWRVNSTVALITAVTCTVLTFLITLILITEGIQNYGNFGRPPVDVTRAWWGWGHSGLSLSTTRWHLCSENNKGLVKEHYLSRTKFANWNIFPAYHCECHAWLHFLKVPKVFLLQKIAERKARCNLHS